MHLARNWTFYKCFWPFVFCSTFISHMNEEKDKERKTKAREQKPSTCKPPPTFALASAICILATNGSSVQSLGTLLSGRGIWFLSSFWNSVFSSWKRPNWPFLLVSCMNMSNLFSWFGCRGYKSWSILFCAQPWSLRQQFCQQRRRLQREKKNLFSSKIS